MHIKRPRFSTFLYGLTAVLLIAVLAFSALSPESRPASATSDGGGTIGKQVYSQTARTMANTTPVTSSPVCGFQDADQFAAYLTLQGTMTGTAPTLDVKVQQSFDGPNGHFKDVGAFAQINATVTPAQGTDLIMFSDVPASTAVTRGDCYRLVTTYGGTGTVTANFGAGIFGR